MKPLRFATVGDNCIDKFLPPVGRSLLGGNAVNVAVQLAILGHKSFYFGAVGPDRDGARTRAVLAQNGVRVEHMQERQGRTAYTDIEVMPSGERVFLHEDFGVCAGYRPTPRDIDTLKTMDHVHIGWLDDGGDLRRTLAEAGVSVSQDVSVNADPANLGTDGLEIAFGSAGEDDLAVDQLIGRFLAVGVAVAVVTRGAKGSVAATSAARARTGIKSVDVVDTTGAGDSFIAGFLSSYIGGDTLQQAVEFGRDRASATCAHVGGFPQEALPL